jgi:hypothetical protein
MRSSITVGDSNGSVPFLERYRRYTPDPLYSSKHGFGLIWMVSFRFPNNWRGSGTRTGVRTIRQAERFCRRRRSYQWCRGCHNFSSFRVPEEQPDLRYESSRPVRSRYRGAPRPPHLGQWRCPNQIGQNVEDPRRLSRVREPSKPSRESRVTCCIRHRAFHSLSAESGKGLCSIPIRFRNRYAKRPARWSFPSSIKEEFPRCQQVLALRSRVAA